MSLLPTLATTTSPTRRTLSAAAISGITLALGVGMGVGAPSAHAQNAESCENPYLAVTGSIDWGVRESFRNYIKGNIAEGSYHTSGAATDQGSYFSFPMSNSYLEPGASSGILAGSGSVQFDGHNGLLKTIITDPILQVKDSDSATLNVWIYSQDTEGNEVPGSSQRVNFADVEFDGDLSQGRTVTGQTNLTAEGASSFAGFYKTGELMDPLTATITGTTESCGERPTYDGNAAGGGGNKDYDTNTGYAGLDTLNLLNRYLQAGTDAVNNTGKLADSLDKLANRGRSGSPAASGGAGAAPGRPSNPASPGNTAGPSSPSSPAAKGGAPSGGGATSNPAGGGSQQASAGTPATGGPVAGGPTAETCSAVTATEVAWGVKESFRSYIRGSIAKGGWQGDGVEYTGGAFRFTGADGSVDPASKSGVLNTAGTLRFNGHGGILDLRISNVQVAFNGNSGQLIANVYSNDMEGNGRDYGRVAMGDLSISGLEISDSAVNGSANVTLTQAGASAFADFYEPGIQLDPLTFSAQLSGETNCQTAGASGSAAGGSGSGKAAAAAAKASGAGAGKAGGSASGSSALGSTDSADAESMYGEEGGNGVQFKNKSKDVKAAGLGGSPLSGWQLAALTAAFLGAAGVCMFIANRHPGA